MAIMGSVDIPFTNSTQIANNAKDTADSAADAAGAALTSADGKNTVYHQTAIPTGGNYIIGDMWFDTANGNRLSIWNGSAWALAKFDYNALTINKLSAISADLGNVTAGNISGVTMNLAGGKFVVDIRWKCNI
jgi:hypothetical protein